MRDTMENKSKCCNGRVTIDPRDHGQDCRLTCDVCFKPCELQKNSGLTLSEDRLLSNKLMVMGDELKAFSEVILQRKSDEAVKQQIYTDKEFREATNSLIDQLQKENEKMKENCEYWSAEYRNIKAKLNKIRELL